MADLTPEGLERIEGLAKAATPGPWYVHRFNEPIDPEGSDFDCRALIKTNGEAHPFPSWLAEISDCLKQDANADFIAAMDPQTVLALVAEVKRLRENVRLLHEYADRMAMQRASHDHCPEFRITCPLSRGE